MQTILQQCAAQLDQIAGARTCIRNLDIFTKRLALSKDPNHLLGFDLNDREYMDLLRQKDYLSLPNFLASQEVLNLIDTIRPNAFAKVEEKIRDYNPQWRAFYYRSRNLPTPDDSQAMGRFLVYVPGAAADRFIQFGIADDPATKLSEVISQIIVEKIDPLSHTPHANPLVYYVDLWRVRRDGVVTITTRLLTVKSSEPCYRCHEYPLLQIKPATDSTLSDASIHQIAEVNSVVRQYASAKIADFTSTDLGPVVGQRVNLGRSHLKDDAFLRSCGGNQLKDDASIERVRAAMNCAACHDGSKHVALHYLSALPDQFPTGANLVKQATFHDAEMPPQSSLNGDERAVLSQCLSKTISSPSDLSGELERWLLQSDCSVEL